MRFYGIVKRKLLLERSTGDGQGSYGRGSELRALLQDSSQATGGANGETPLVNRQSKLSMVLVEDNVSQA